MNTYLFLNKLLQVKGIRNGKAPFDGLAGIESLDPVLDMLKLVEINIQEGKSVGPAEDGNVGNGELLADQPWSTFESLFRLFGQSGIQDRIQSFRLGDVSLDGVGDLLGRKAEEMVCLSLVTSVLNLLLVRAVEVHLHRSNTTMLP